MPSSQNTYMVGIRSVADYSPFGVELDGRTQSGAGYRYSFQGQEKDDEIKGEGNSVNYKYRMHDPRVGRFFAVDPLYKKFAWNGYYNFSENVVIHDVELEGLERASRVRRVAYASPGTGRIVSTVIGRRTHMQSFPSSLRTGRPTKTYTGRPANRFEVQQSSGQNFAQATRNIGTIKSMLDDRFEEMLREMSGEIEIIQTDYFKNDMNYIDNEVWYFSNSSDKDLLEELETEYYKALDELVTENLKEQGYYKTQEEQCVPCVPKEIDPETIPSAEKRRDAEMAARLVLGASPKEKLKTQIISSPKTKKSSYVIKQDQLQKSR